MIRTAREAKALADAYLERKARGMFARYARRVPEYRAWEVTPRSRTAPDDLLMGGPLVVTEEGDIYECGSAPGSLEMLMMDIGRIPLLPMPATNTDSEALALLADMDPQEAAELAAWSQAQQQKRRVVQHAEETADPAGDPGTRRPRRSHD